MHTTPRLLLALLVASASCVAPHSAHGFRHDAPPSACERCAADEPAHERGGPGRFERERRGDVRRGPPEFARGPERDFTGPGAPFGPRRGPPPGRPPFARGGGPDGPEREFDGFHARDGGARGPEREPRGELRGPRRGPGGGPGVPPFGPRGGPGRGPGLERRPPSPDELAAVLAELTLTPEQRERADRELAELRAHRVPRPERAAPETGSDGSARPPRERGPELQDRPRHGPAVWHEILGDEAFAQFRERLRARLESGTRSPAGGDGPRPPASPPAVPPAGQPAPPRDARSA